MNNKQLTRAYHVLLTEVEKLQLLVSVLVDRGVLSQQDIHRATLQVELTTLERRIELRIASPADIAKVSAVRLALTRLT